MIHTLVEPPVDSYYFASDEVMPPSPSPSAVAALEKTRMCVYYLQGRCKYDDCSFAHSVHELKQAPSNLRKTKLCDLFMMGHCFDAQCNFAHSTEELKAKPKRSASPTVIPGSGVGFDRYTFDRNTEACSRTILSMLVKMAPEAAVAFLSNPECKIMLEQLLEEPDIEDPVENSSTVNSSGIRFATPTSSDIGSISAYSPLTPTTAPFDTTCFNMDSSTSQRLTSRH